MCLIVVAVGATSQHPLVVAANRDEQHARPGSAAAWWADSPHVLGGRDLKAGGTWLAIDRRGRFAAVTNVRDPEAPAGPRSRGELVTGFLAGSDSAERYAAHAVRSGGDYGAFNLLLYAGSTLHFASNRGAAAELAPGIHAFSNAPRGVEWPKTASARAAAERTLGAPSPVEPLFALLAQRDEGHPTGQRYQHAHFVVGETYGTRCSTVVVVDAGGRVTFAERSFDSTGRLIGEVRESFAIGGL